MKKNKYSRHQPKCSQVRNSDRLGKHGSITLDRLSRSNISSSFLTLLSLFLLLYIESSLARDIMLPTITPIIVGKIVLGFYFHVYKHVDSFFQRRIQRTDNFF